MEIIIGFETTKSRPGILPEVGDAARLFLEEKGYTRFLTFKKIRTELVDPHPAIIITITNIAAAHKESGFELNEFTKLLETHVTNEVENIKSLSLAPESQIRYCLIKFVSEEDANRTIDLIHFLFKEEYLNENDFEKISTNIMKHYFKGPTKIKKENQFFIDYGVSTQKSTNLVCNFKDMVSIGHVSTMFEGGDIIIVGSTRRGAYHGAYYGKINKAGESVCNQARSSYVVTDELAPAHVLMFAPEGGDEYLIYSLGDTEATVTPGKVY